MIPTQDLRKSAKKTVNENEKLKYIKKEDVKEFCNASDAKRGRGGGKLGLDNLISAGTEKSRSMVILIPI